MGAVAIATSGTQVREAARIRGGVQGVGFRPFVHGLAVALDLAGHVGNDTGGVFLEVEGDAADVADFFTALTRDAPARARIESVDRTVVPLQRTGAFSIVDSAPASRGGVGGGMHALVQPDIAVCDACLAELRDPADRRFGYPFINCSHCGPRYTIVHALPYDRAATTMAAFTMCDTCRAEYDTPAHRRFHAQPNACPACGPRLWFEVPTALATAQNSNAVAAETTLRLDDPIVRALRCLADDGTVAVKGIGGVHLACSATSTAAIARLRARKQRPHKPLAVMVADIDTARCCANLSPDECALLDAAERPIVLVRARDDSPLAALVAPGQDVVGLMLPYTPLHHLLLARGPLVMTSGNLSDEPIAFTNEDARTRLGSLCDGLLLHDREIAMPCDDSVLRIAERQLLPLRRSRGYAPYPVPLAAAVPPVLGIGGELKSTMCLTRDAHAFLSPHIGDVGGLETRALLQRTVEQLSRLLDVRPVRVACDAHPGYASAALARAWATVHNVPVTVVQHHHAHVASLMAEHGIVDERVIGVAFDGTGYGSDGTIWGGEVLVANYVGFDRVTHLACTWLPGGDAAVKHPARVALAQLQAAGISWDDDLEVVAASSRELQRVLAQQLQRGTNCVASSSMGRWFDAVAALLGVRHQVTYEGQAAIELEALAARAAGRYPADDAETDGRYRFALESDQFDGAPVLRAIVEDLRTGVETGMIAWRAHAAVADAVARIAVRVRHSHGLHAVGLTGGVFQNTLLLSMTCARLHAQDFRVLTHHKVPPNDGGLALGQAMIAAAQQARTR